MQRAAKRKKREREKGACETVQGNERKHTSGGRER